MSKKQFMDTFNHLECILYTHHTETENGKRQIALVFSGENGITNRVILELPAEMEQPNNVPVEVTCQYDLDCELGKFTEVTKEIEYIQY